MAAPNVTRAPAAVIELVAARCAPVFAVWTPAAESAAVAWSGAPVADVCLPAAWSVDVAVRVADPVTTVSVPGVTIDSFVDRFSNRLVVAVVELELFAVIWSSTWTYSLSPVANVVSDPLPVAVTTAAVEVNPVEGAAQLTISVNVPFEWRTPQRT